MEHTHTKNGYALLDSGMGKKLEKWGPYLLSRPASQAVWNPSLGEKEWNQADAVFTREPLSRWLKKEIPEEGWHISLENILLHVAPTDFGHLGVFPEHSLFWPWMKEKIEKRATPPQILNLFAYSGSTTSFLLKQKASLCHVDASQGMIDWAKKNAALNGLQNTPVRWIVDDVFKFLQREVKRGRKYDAIILDPPSFGRGTKGEVFKIEEDLLTLLTLCKEVLSDTPLFILFTSHTAGFTPYTMETLLKDFFKEATIEKGDLQIPALSKKDLPSGVYGRVSW